MGNLLTFEDIHRALFDSFRTQEFFSWTPQPLDYLEEHLTGNCTDRAALMQARCKAAGLDTEICWVRCNTIPHLVVVEKATQLVSDQLLRTMRVRPRRIDLTEWREWDEAKREH